MSSAKKIRHVKEEQQFSDDVDQKRDFINSLDYYSLEKIFMLLPICDRINMKKVCTKWREELCRLAWYNIEKYKCTRSIGCAYDDQLLTELYVESLVLIFGIHLRKLILSKICTSSIMSIIGEHCQNLTRLEFVFDESLPVNTHDYIQAFKKLDKIKFIKINVINEVSRRTTKLKSEILCSLPEEINEIHVIFKTSSCFGKPWHIDLKKFTSLQSLTLSGCNIDEIIQQISGKVTLVYLNLEYSFLSPGLLHLNDDIFNRLVNLEHIHLFENFCGVSPYFLRNIFDTCKNLRYFDVTKSRSYGHPALIKNWENHNNLEHLAIVWFLEYDSALEIVKYCNNLKCLLFKKSISDSAILKLTELKNLEHLELPSRELSEDSIRIISNNCEKLKHLEIPFDIFSHFFDREDYDDDNNGPAVLQVTIYDELSKLEYLEYLNVSGVRKLTDSSIIAVANKCKSLKNLNISHCNYITEAGLDAITNMESLQKLNVSNVKSVTNSFIIKLKGLQSLAANECEKITDSGIIQFIKNCPDLEQLYLRKTNMTTNTIIAADQETKNRINDIILYIHSWGCKIEKSCRPLIQSKSLVINYS